MKTNDLEKMVLESSEFDEELIRQNGALPVFVLIEKHLQERELTKTKLIQKLNVERTYGYQLMNGTRTPTREWLIKICLVLGLNLEETQRLLKTGCKNILYVRNIKDAKTIYAIEHKMKYEEALDFIWNENVQ